MSGAPWKPVSDATLSVPEREREEHGPKPLRFDSPGVHADLVYDFTVTMTG